MSIVNEFDLQSRNLKKGSWKVNVPQAVQQCGNCV